MAPRQGHQMRSADRAPSVDPDLDGEAPAASTWHTTMADAPKDGRPIGVREEPDGATTVVRWLRKRQYVGGRWVPRSGWCLHDSRVWLGFEPAEWTHWDFLYGPIPAKEQTA